MNSIIKHMIDDLHEENRDLLATVERLKDALREEQSKNDEQTKIIIDLTGEA